MPYIVRSTERTRSGGDEFETSALFYMMNFHPKKKKIFYFVIDLFNDLTVFNEDIDRNIDVQSKKSKSSPEIVGTELVTLFKNYISDFYFDQFILFYGGVTGDSLVDKNLEIYGIENFKKSAKKDLINAFKIECFNKSYIDNNRINDLKINTFFEKVKFVKTSKTKTEYIRAIINSKAKIFSDEYLEKIFDGFKKQQASLKENKVEGATLNNISDFLNFKRHFTIDDVRKYILNLAINYEWMNTKSIPVSLVNYISGLTSDEIKDKIDNFEIELARILFDRNNKRMFWKFFDDIYKNLTKNSGLKPQEIYPLLDKNILQKMNKISKDSTIFFISIIKDGLEI